MQSLRDERAQSMMAEMEKTVAMAESDLAARNEKLAQFETKIGADLAELRSLNAVVGAQSEASQELQSIETERRANDAKQRENEQLLALLKAAQDDPRQLIARLFLVCFRKELSEVTESELLGHIKLTIRTLL